MRRALTVTHLVPVLGLSTRSSAEYICFMVSVGSSPVEWGVSAQPSTSTKINNICVTSPEFRVFAKVAIPWSCGASILLRLTVPMAIIDHYSLPSLRLTDASGALKGSPDEVKLTLSQLSPFCV